MTVGSVPLSVAQGVAQPIMGELSGAAAEPDSLLTDLVSWWSLDEASGARVDSHGSNNLSDNNTVTQAAGKVGNAGQFTAANSEYLELAASQDEGLYAGARDFTVSAWVYLDALWVAGVPTAASVGGDTTTPAITDWRISLAPTNKMAFGVANESPQVGRSVTANTFGALSADTWYNVIAYYENATTTLGIIVNDTTPDESDAASTLNISDSPFRIGRWATYYWDGRVDEVAFWERLLTAEEITRLAAGMAYPG